MAEVIDGILIRDVETKNIMTKSSLPVGGYSVNPYVGCTHACKYCYASFMKRFTGHTEEWGTFLDVKHWPEIKNPKKYAGQRVVIGSVTDGYNPQEEQFRNTRKLLEQLIGSDADILICTKSDLVVRDIDLLKKLGRVTVSWSINTLDENFKNDMDSASSIERRIAAMKQVYDAGIRTVCFVSPVFPGITDFEAIFERVKDQCDLFWLENLNLRGSFKKTIMDYIAGKHPNLVPLYDEIYNKHNRSYFEALEVKAEKVAKKYDCAFVDNEMPYGRVPQGHPVIVDFCPTDFLMIEIIHDHRMSLRDSAIRHFIIHKGTIILLSHFLSFYFKCFKVATVMLVIDLVVKWYKIWILSGDIIHNCLFETASKIEIFEPEQIALILYPIKDCFKIRDTGKYRGYETDCTDTCFIYLLHSSDTALNARSRVHIVLEIFI